MRRRDDDYIALSRIYHIYMPFESDHDNLPAALDFCRQAIHFYQQADNPDRIAHATRRPAGVDEANQPLEGLREKG